MRWDKLSGAEKRALSKEIAAGECEDTGVPLIASEEQHRRLAALVS